MAVASGHEADNVYFEDDEEEEEYDDDEVEDDDDDDDDESCSDQSSTTSTSTSNNQRVDGGRVCDCCYCEVFGHGMPAVAPTSRNYNEMRERLRSRLNKRKAERGRCENRSNVSAIGNDKRKEVVGKEDNRDLEELLNYIEGTNNRDANKPGKTKKKKEKQKKKKEKQKDKKSSSSLNIMNSSVDSETSNPNQSDSKTNVLKCNLSEPASNHKDNYSNASKEDKSTQAIFDLSTPSGSHNLSPHVERTKERKHSDQIDHNSYRNTSASDHKVACNHSISSSNIKKTKEEKRRNGDETKSDKNQIILTEFASTDSHEGQQPTHQISQERHNHVRCSSSTPTSLVNHERSLSHGSINISNSTSNSSTSRTTTIMSKVASSTSTTLYPSRTPSSPPPIAPTSITTTSKLEATSKSSLTLSLITSVSSSTTTTTTISSSPSRSSSSTTKTSSSTTSNDISDHCVNPSTTFRSKNGQKFSQTSGLNNASNKKPHQDRLKESIPSSDKRNCLNLATHNSSHQLIEETLSSTPKNSKRRDKRENKSRNKNISDDILSPDEVFRPKDIDLENDELDETEKEIEAFKRFCYNSVPLARKDKVNVHVNLKDILFKRSPISGNLEIKHSVKNEPGK